MLIWLKKNMMEPLANTPLYGTQAWTANGIKDRTHLKTLVKDDLAKFIYKEIKRKPMILPIIMDL